VQDWTSDYANLKRCLINDEVKLWRFKQVSQDDFQYLELKDTRRRLIKNIEIKNIKLQCLQAMQQSEMVDNYDSDDDFSNHRYRSGEDLDFLYGKVVMRVQVK